MYRMALWEKMGIPQKTIPDVRQMWDGSRLEYSEAQNILLTYKTINTNAYQITVPADKSSILQGAWAKFLHFEGS